MSRNDDLAQVFAGPPNPAPDFVFRQGTVVTWNLLSGVGSVSVGGTILTSVPFMSTGAIVYLLPGDTVILLKQGASWFILGRVNSPGGLAGVGRNTQVVLTGDATQVNFNMTTSFVTRVNLVLNVPSWASVATLDVKFQSLIKNTSAVTDFARNQILMPDGASTNFSSGNCLAGAWASTVHCMSRQVLCTPGGTLTIQGQVASTAGAWAADSGNTVYLTCTVVYNSNA